MFDFITFFRGLRSLKDATSFLKIKFYNLRFLPLKKQLSLAVLFAFMVAIFSFRERSPFLSRWNVT